MRNLQHLPDEALVRLRDLEGLTGLSRSTLWRRVSAGAFPRPLRQGAITAWRWREVGEWLDAFGSDGEPTA